MASKEHSSVRETFKYILNAYMITYGWSVGLLRLQGYMYEAINDYTTPVPNFPSHIIFDQIWFISCFVTDVNASIYQV